MKSRILTLDLGNTTLAGGVWEEGALKDNWSYLKAGGEFRKKLAKKFKELEKAGGVDSALFASVVPRETESVLSLCRKWLNVDCHLLSASTPTGLKIFYHPPEQMGADRIANAVGVYRCYGAPAIVVDFGTAITFDVVSKRFEYLGGVIAPGLGISTEALFRKTALLPRVKISPPERILGRDTISAIQAGVFYGTLGLIEKIIRELKKELGWKRDVKLVATGGQARLILSRSRLIRIIDPFLTLKGLFFICRELNSRRDASISSIRPIGPIKMRKGLDHESRSRIKRGQGQQPRRRPSSR